MTETITKPIFDDKRKLNVRKPSQRFHVSVTRLLGAMLTGAVCMMGFANTESIEGSRVFKPGV